MHGSFAASNTSPPNGAATAKTSPTLVVVRLLGRMYWLAQQTNTAVGPPRSLTRSIANCQLSIVNLAHEKWFASLRAGRSSIDLGKQFGARKWPLVASSITVGWDEPGTHYDVLTTRFWSA